MAAWAIKRQGADVVPLRLRRRRLYILPTRAGLGFAAVLLGMLLAALNYGNGTALGLAGLLGGLALVAMHQCHRNLLELEIASIETTPGFAGGRGLMTLALTNDGRIGRLRVQVEADGATRAAVVDLAPNATARAVLEVPTPRRGRPIRTAGATSRIRVKVTFSPMRISKSRIASSRVWEWVVWGAWAEWI